MKVTDIVKIQQFVLSLEDFPKYAATRAKFLGSHRSASTAVVVKALVRPDWLVEVEAVAAKAARPASAAAKKPAARKRTTAKPRKR